MSGFHKGMAISKPLERELIAECVKENSDINSMIEQIWQNDARFETLKLVHKSSYQERIKELYVKMGKELTSTNYSKLYEKFFGSVEAAIICHQNCVLSNLKYKAGTHSKPVAPVPISESTNYDIIAKDVVAYKKINKDLICYECLVAQLIFDHCNSVQNNRSLDKTETLFPNLTDLKMLLIKTIIESRDHALIKRILPEKYGGHSKNSDCFTATYGNAFAQRYPSMDPKRLQATRYPQMEHHYLDFSEIVENYIQEKQQSQLLPPQQKSTQQIREQHQQIQQQQLQQRLLLEQHLQQLAIQNLKSSAENENVENENAVSDDEKNDEEIFDTTQHDDFDDCCYDDRTSSRTNVIVTQVIIYW
jgi:hypothetical protein